MRNKEKLKIYQRNWLAKRKHEWLLKNGPCNHCGSWNNLEVDHIDPKSKTTHRVWSWAEHKRTIELLKCQALCRRCHRSKTILEHRIRSLGQPRIQSRKFTKSFIFKVLKEYFIKGTSRRKTASKFDISQGTLSGWIYGDQPRNHCAEWVKEFKQKHKLASG